MQEKMLTKSKKTRGGKRSGAGRPNQGKERFTVTLTAKNAVLAKSRTENFSALLDELLSEWLARKML